ncbi:MAG: flagellar protein FlaG [Betaproteobacteria bacterium]|nr:flagellar protein FlaG [Betaproteobacteria bacterium]
MSIVTSASTSASHGTMPTGSTKIPSNQGGISIGDQNASAEQISAQISAARSSKAPSVQESAKVTRESVEVAAEKIRSFASSMNRDLDIRFDNSSKSTIMVVTDPRSNEVVRQIPAPEVVELARTIDYLSSLLVSKKA